MRFTYLLFSLCFTILAANGVYAIDFSGKNALYILGKDRNSREFREFRDVWHLDKQDESNTRGVKVYVNDRNEKVESVLFAGDNYKYNTTSFVKYSSVLPFDLSFSDDTSKLVRKLGQPEKLMGRNALKFNKQNTAVEVVYGSSDNSKIAFIKYYHEVPKPVVASQPEAKPTMKVYNEPKKPSVLMASVGKIFDYHEPTGSTTASEVKAKPIEADISKTEEKFSAFKVAIMDVFKAYKESGFYSIKSNVRPINNFWNYKYTYNTKLKIPGEKFNMLYSFPFSSSQLDFVSVLKEGDVFDKAFEQTYHKFEKQLMETFPAKDGWVASCIPNKESKNISDLEFRNDRYGAVVLDYCRNPKGKHIVYLRFLLFSN